MDLFNFDFHVPLDQVCFLDQPRSEHLEPDHHRWSWGSGKFEHPPPQPCLSWHHGFHQTWISSEVLDSWILVEMSVLQSWHQMHHTKQRATWNNEQQLELDSILICVGEWSSCIWHSIIESLQAKFLKLKLKFEETFALLNFNLACLGIGLGLWQFIWAWLRTKIKIYNHLMFFNVLPPGRVSTISFLL